MQLAALATQTHQAASNVVFGNVHPMPRTVNTTSNPENRLRQIEGWKSPFYFLRMSIKGMSSMTFPLWKYTQLDQEMTNTPGCFLVDV
jgi:hypothetical protein